ncbi:MAG: PIG-L family deacetylase [Rhodothermales bacterium]|nr:PIG-L family deacetylase [Rhodothermales bacterium]
MIGLGLGSRGEPTRIMFIGAHSDDIEIGCGGTILKLLSERPEIEITWVVLSSNKRRRLEAEKSASRFLSAASSKAVRFGSFTDGFFPSEKAAIKGFFESELKGLNPDIIFTHTRGDLHQDHQVVNQLTWNTFRNQLIFEYEIPKYDGDMGNPNVFVSLTESQLDDKLETLLDVFSSQGNRHWFRDSLFRGIAAIRGMQCAAPSGYAEAFYSRKIVLEL